MKSLWNRPDNPQEFRIAIFVFYFSVFLITLRIDFTAYSEIPQILFAPTQLNQWLGFGVLKKPWLLALSMAWRVTLILCAFDFHSRIARPLAFAAGFYLLTLDSQFGWEHRESVPCLAALLILTLTNGALASRAILTVFVYVYFAAGVSKLRASGLDWLSGEALFNHVIYARYLWFERIDSMHTASWASFVFNAVKPGWMAAFVMACELLAPLALFSRFAAAGLISALVVNQVSVFLIMGPNYLLNLPLLAFFLPWERLRWILYIHK